MPWRTRSLSLLLFATASLAACGAEEPESDGTLCPVCTPQAGGETSDFGGLQSSCSGTPLPLTPELAQQYEVDEVRARVEGPFEASLRWTISPYIAEQGGSSGSQYARPPSGFDELTRVQGQIALEAPVFFEGYDINGRVDHDCPDWVELPAQVALATADAALTAATAKGALRISKNHLVPTLFATADLTDVQGQLDLHVKPGGNRRGELLVLMSAFPEGLRGELLPRVLGEDAISGHWPGDDGCDDLAFPLGIDSPHPWLEGRSPRQELMQWQTAIADSAPALGRWLDGSEVSIQVALDAPPQACVGAAPGGGAYVTIEDPGRLTTSDGRVNAPLVRGALFPSRFLLVSDGRRLMPAEFEARTGIRGIDALGSPWLSALVETTYERTATGITIEGALEVDGQPRCAKPNGPCAADPRELGAGIDCLNWPPRDFFEFCGRHLR